MVRGERGADKTYTDSFWSNQKIKFKTSYTD